MHYDGMSNHDLLFIVVQQLNEKLIDKQDLEAFSAEGQAFIQGILNLRNI